MTEAPPRADDVYNPPNEMEFGVWTASMGRLTNNPDGWERFFIAIRRADGMVLFMENFKSLLHSQVQQAAQEAGLVRESPRTRTLPRPAQHSAHLSARAHRCQWRHLLIARLKPTTMTLSFSPHRAGPWTTSATTSSRGGRPRGTSRTTRSPTSPLSPTRYKTSLTLGSISGGSFEKKFENMRVRKSIGYELGVDVVQNLVFPQAVEDKFAQIFGVSAGWPQERPMPARKVSQVRFFPAPIIDII